MIRWAWLNTYRELPVRLRHDRVVQSWDTASKVGELNDYSVCTTWFVQGNNYYLVDVFRKRLEFPYLRRQIISEAHRHGADVVLIEDAASGMHLIQDLQRSGDLRPIAMRPEGDKVTRMAAHTATLEAGYVHIPEKAAWLPDLRTELLSFPHGVHDDQVDSISQFLTWVSRPVARPSIEYL